MLACAVAFNKPEGNRHGIGVLYTGGCKNVERSATLLAIPINIISTILVATSNYVMQCLSAPTRKDIDRAHAAGSYLNIGISSVHNLIHNVSWKSALWLVLVITTIPIHLLLNSAFFGALEANNYGVLVATEGWQTQEFTIPQDEGTWTFSDWIDQRSFFNDTTNTAQAALTDRFALYVWQLSQDQIMQVLSKDDCFKRYSKQLQSTYSNLVVVTKETTGIYTTIPALTTNDVEEEYVDPYTGFELPDAVGLSLNPYSGNGVLTLNESGHWQHGIVTANDSGGLYLFAADYAFDVPGVRSIWSAFDYHYWMFAKHLEYDFNKSEILRAGQWSPTSWLCPAEDVVAGGQTCTSGKNAKAPDPWLVTPQDFEVDHCLSQKVDEQCSLQYSFTILIIVICCDIAKILAMCAALWLVSVRPLATIGDAIASFLETPDTHTVGCCLIEQTQARTACHKSPFRWVPWRPGSQNQRYQHANRTFAEKIGPAATVWKQKVVRWYAVPSKSRWIAFGILYIGLLGASIAILAIGIRDLSQLGIDNPFDQGFGSINPNVSSPLFIERVASGLISTCGKARSRIFSHAS